MTIDQATLVRLARIWTQRPLGQRLQGRVTPTEYQLRDLRLPVSDARFERAMSMAARDMGGTYNSNTSTIHLPREIARPGDHSFPTEITVLYRKFPCGFIMKDSDNEAAGLPCVSFDVIPNVGGDPRSSRIYQSFKGDAGLSKILFGKFLGWLKIISKAVKRYREQVEQGRPVSFARTAAETRVAEAWFSRKTERSRSL